MPSPTIATRPLPLEAAPLIDDAEVVADSHGVYRHWRPKTPILRMQGDRTLVLRAADVMRLFGDPRTAQIPGAVFATRNAIPAGRVTEMLDRIMLLSNPPDHVRRRRAVAKGFAFPVIKARRHLVTEVAHRAVAEMPRQVPVDFVATVAVRIPSEAIARLLGLPESDAPDFAGWVHQVSRALTPRYPLDAHERIEAAAENLHAYLSAALARRRAAPSDDLLSVFAADQGNLGHADLVYQTMMVVIGGSDTTRTTMAAGLAALLGHGEAWQKLRSDRALIPGAVAEMLRWEPAVGSVLRVAMEQIKLPPYSIPAGTALALSIQSATRDPEMFADPDRFDILRKDHPRLPLSFGGGVHRCLGEMLARIELEEALSAVLDQIPSIRLIEPPRMLGMGGVRSTTEMTVIA